MSGYNRRTVQSRDALVQLEWVSVATELRRSFMPYAEWLAEFAPRWCACIVVEHDPKDTEAAIRVVTKREYNRAHVILGCGWTTEPVPKRWDIIVHELVHVYSAAVTEYTEDLDAVEWKANPELKEARQQQYQHADESFTEDMARLLCRYLPKPNLRNDAEPTRGDASGSTSPTDSTD